MSELGRGGHPADAVDAVDAVDGDGDVVDAPPSTDAGGVGVADVDAAEVSDRTVDADRAPRGMSDRYVDDDDDIFTGTDDAEDRDEGNDGEAGVVLAEPPRPVAERDGDPGSGGSGTDTEKCGQPGDLERAYEEVVDGGTNVDTVDGPDAVVRRPDLPPGMAVVYGVDGTFRRDQLVRTVPFDGPPRREQAVQGDLADCGVIAALGAVAGHRPEAISDLIRTRADGVYEVSLHETSQDLGGIWRPTGRRVVCEVTPELPVRGGFPYYAACAGTHLTGVSWAAILEKTLAGHDQTWPAERLDTTAHRGYDRLNQGSNPWNQAEILSLLTGEPAAAYRLNREPGNEAVIEAWFGDRLDHHAPVLVGTTGLGKDGESVAGFAPLHVYEVVDVHNGMVSLHNPWGDEHLPAVSMRDLFDRIQTYAVSLYDDEHRPPRPQ